MLSLLAMKLIEQDKNESFNIDKIYLNLFLVIVVLVPLFSGSKIVDGINS